jgi:hypothetical protein
MMLHNDVPCNKDDNKDDKVEEKEEEDDNEDKEEDNNPNDSITCNNNIKANGSNDFEDATSSLFPTTSCPTSINSTTIISPSSLVSFP